MDQPQWRCAKVLTASRLDSSLAHRSQLQYCTQFATDDNPTTNTQVSRQHRQHAYLRRFLQRSKDLPGQGALQCRSRVPPSAAARGRHSAIAPQQSEHLAEGDDGDTIMGRALADGIYRASFTSVVTARSSASRTARASPFSSSARTLARFTGPLSTEGRTRRVSLRLVAAHFHMHIQRWDVYLGQQ